MLIQFANVKRRLSRFVKMCSSFHYEQILLSVFFAMLVITVISGISSCQSTIRFSSKAGEETSSSSRATPHTPKHRASSSTASTTPKIVYPPERLNDTQERLLSAAARWLGTPYRYGSTTRAGTDCSGFVMRVFEESGIGMLPRSTKDQFSIGTPVEREQLRTGDLLFFNTNGVGVSHVGLYVGRDSVIHASSTYGVVKQSLSETYLTRVFVGARRVL